MTPVTPPVGIAADALLDLLMKSGHLVRNGLDAVLEEWSLTDARYAVLAVLSGFPGGCAQNELARRLMQSDSNVSVLVDRLEVDEMLERIVSATDRRKRVLKLTETGRLTYQSIQTRRREWAEQCLRLLDADRRQQLGLWLRSIQREAVLVRNEPGLLAAGLADANLASEVIPSPHFAIAPSGEGTSQAPGMMKQVR